MAIPPTIPTSFVPKQPVQTTRRARTGTNVFMLVSFIVAGLALAGTVATFAYEKYLEQAHDGKAAELAAAEASISRDTVEEFLRLRDRFNATDTLLDQHVALSQFFDLLEAVTLTNVQFGTMSLIVDEGRVATLSMSGSAASFNALAAESTAFANEKRIRRAIFSGISTNETGRVSFTLDAELDPRLVIWDGVGTVVDMPAIEEASEDVVETPEVPAVPPATEIETPPVTPAASPAL
ncbi:MAG TPA: hypothetical protein VHO23_02040 [Candidatus Paceibacterota bacterium]|nr:hypothetical protein [Candidatus Paceibacterota bacterium]